MSTNVPDSSDRTAATRSRRVVASYENYKEAERAVDHLSDNHFPVERVSIVGRGLQLVEQVTGRATYGSSALQGALSGALVGFLVGWLFAVFNWSDPVIASGWLIVHGLWFGALVGAGFGLLQHAMLGGRRDFSSLPTMQAERYDVLVDEEVADEAARLLSRLGQPPAGDGGATARA
jgi:hypothetical protein